MNIKKHIERVLDDEGLTSGLADPEAKVLMDWLVHNLEAKLPRTKSDAAARELTKTEAARARRLAAIIDKICYNDDRAAAERLWNAAGRTQALNTLPAADPVAVARQLIQWETASDA